VTLGGDDHQHGMVTWAITAAYRAVAQQVWTADGQRSDLVYRAGDVDRRRDRTQVLRGTRLVGVVPVVVATESQRLSPQSSTLAAPADLNGNVTRRARRGR
jgi:hypothetical protein